MTVDTMEMVKMIRSGDKMGIQIYLRKGGDPNARNQMCWTLLHLACFEGQSEIAELLVENGGSVNACTTDMSTPLHRACAQGNKIAVEMLLKKGAYINAQEKNGNTPLHEAARGFHTSVVKLLLEKKADKTKLNKKNQTFLNYIGQQLMPSVESGDSEVLQQWLEWGASPDTKGNLHWSILHHACARGQVNIASLLIERGADVNIEDSNRTTPLHSACFHGHARIASLLIDSNANINAQDQRGNTPMHSAVSGAHPELVNLLLGRECDTTIANKEGQYFTHLVNEFLVTAVDGSKVAQVVSLLEGRADPNARDPYGYTVLCQAAFKGDVLIADALLEGGADPNLTDETQGKTPLHYAAAWGHLFVVKSLLDKGASVTIKDKVGATALHEAAREGFEDVMVVLIGRGCVINEADKDGNTPLHIAGKWGQTAAVELLLEKCVKENLRNKSNLLYSDLALIRAVRTADKDHVMSGMAWGGDPNSRDPRGWTLLHHAVYKGVEDICELLLDNGANVNALDAHDRTPLLLAAYRGNQQIMQLLLDAGADIDAQDWMGRTPLHWAAKEGSIDTVQMLIDHKANRSIQNKEGHLYSYLLLKHLYFAVRHNDADKVVRLVMAGADQFGEVEGTGINPREEAKRRGFYDILRQMAALAEKKPQQEDDKVIALEDVYRLFEDGDFTTPEEDQGECEEEEEEQEQEEEGEEEERNESEDDNCEGEEDAYWKMSNAYEVLTVEEAFGEEDCAWLNDLEEKPKVISAKELLEEEQAAFWDGWQEKQKVISAKEFFKEESDWWEKNDADEDKIEDEEDNEFNRDDECWWRDARDNLDKPKPISAKEYFKEETAWWENDNDDEKEEKKGSLKESLENDMPWWESEDKRSKLVSTKEIFKDEEKPWWQEDKAISAKDFFQEEKPWWQDDDKEKILSAKDLLKEEEVPWWQDENQKVISAKEFCKDDELPWWYTEELHPEQPEGLKKSLASVRFYERYLLNKQMCEEKAKSIECDPEFSDDEVEESTRTDDYEDATDSLISDSSTMYSASEGDRPSSGTESRDIPWWKEGKLQPGEQKQPLPKADEFFQEKHWLDDASETSEPTETLDMDTSEISEIATATELSPLDSWKQEKTAKTAGDDEGSYEESEMDEEDYEMEEEEEEVEEESGELEEEMEEEEDFDDEMGEEECDSESEDLKSEDEIEEISDEELEIVELKPAFGSTRAGTNISKASVKLNQKIPDESLGVQSKGSEVQKEIDIPSIVLHEIGSEKGDNQWTNRTRERTRTKSTDEFPSVELIPKVVSKSYDSLEKGNTNLDIEVTNNDSLIDPNHYSVSVHEIEGNLQKSDSQTSGYDSSLSLSDSKIRDLSKDSGCEALSVDECIEDTDLSDMTNPVSTETTESLEESISGGQDECQPVKNFMHNIQLNAKELRQVNQVICDTAVRSQEGNTAITIGKNKMEKDANNKIFIQMKWDKEEDGNISNLQTETIEGISLAKNLDDINSQTSDNQSRTKESETSIEKQQALDAESLPSDVKTNKHPESVKKDNDVNSVEVKTYASVVKTNLEKPTVNKMDDCLAKLDASLAWVDARLTKESEERTSNENLREKMNGNKELTYAGVMKGGKDVPVAECKAKTPEDSGTRMPDKEPKIKEEKDTVQFMKVHVHVPEEESAIEEERDESESDNGPEKRRFAGGTIPKKHDCKEMDSPKSIKYVSQLPKELDVDSKYCNMTSVRKEVDTVMDDSSVKAENLSLDAKAKSEERVRETNKNNGLNESSMKDDSIDIKEGLKNVESQGAKTKMSHISGENTLPPDKEKENLLSSDDQDIQSVSGSFEKERDICDETKGESAESKKLSRESSIERLSPKERSASPGLQMERTIWRCSTYDAMSISDYDNIAFMIQKSSSSPANWGSKKKRKGSNSSTDSLDQGKDVLTNDSSEKTNDNRDDSVLSNTRECKNDNVPSTGESDSRFSSSEIDMEYVKETMTSTDDPNGTKSPASLNTSGRNLTHINVPEASSVPLPEETKGLGAEACTNLRETSSNQDPPVAPRRTKDASLLSQNVKYKVADHSADTQSTSPHALKQPTNSTLYDPDKKETSKVAEAAVNVRPDEPTVQQVSTKRRSKEGTKKDKEKQKELAVATGKIDPVRKSSSCSVS